MKAAQLKALLETVDDELDIIIQKDAEGNGYSPLSGADADAIYISDTPYSGEVYSTVWSAEDCCMEEDEWKKFKADNPRCVILYPVN